MRLVPLRTTMPFRVTWSQGQVSLKGFYFPHCVAFVANFRCVDAHTLDETVNTCYAIHIHNTETFQGLDLKGRKSASLQDLAIAGVSFLSQQAIGGTLTPGIERPFTLFSIVNADPNGGSLKVEGGSSEHRALEALTSWLPNPKTAALPKLEDATVVTKGPPDVGRKLLYAGERGRAVWFAPLFTETGETKTVLSLYHRNLVLGSMQTESLCRLIGATSDLLRLGTPFTGLKVIHQNCVSNAAKSLTRLFLGDRRETYRSGSLQRQIRKHPRNALADLNDLRRILDPSAVPLS